MAEVGAEDLRVISFTALKRARRTLEDFALSYFPLHGLDLKDYIHHQHIFNFVEGLIYQTDDANEAMCLQEDKAHGQDFKHEGHKVLKDVLRGRHLLSDEVDKMLAQGDEYWRLERKICESLKLSAHFLKNSATTGFSLQEAQSASKMKSFDYRVLHCILHQVFTKSRSQLMMEFLELDEQLLDIGDDLVDYEEDVIKNSFNIYRAYLYLYGADGGLKLAEYIAELEETRDTLLIQLPDDIQMAVTFRQKEAATKPGSDKWIIPAPIFNEAEFRNSQQTSSGSS
ncbi:hypothetical protein BSKO_01245 [Bryopsis sp. KO-2023]|nr:hypothetical protein BSKO_01245 [Bryopsis sp. KO-2023]